VLYATNTLGAVFGTLITTFYIIENLGNRATLFVAVGLNIIVGITAIALASEVTTAEAAEETDRAEAAPAGFILTSAAVVGFAFLLMELIWYRMLSPVLGGTTFMFGLILAIALLGIGLGGAAYALRGDADRATIGGFALTCTLEALAIIIPFSLGDRIAIVANLIRPLGHLGFYGHIIGWCAITLVVVFPAAFISGIQFPLLIALLGRGRERVGRHVGNAYAFNTLGAIAGSLAGGFGLMPLMGAPACWVVVAFLFIALGAVAAFLAIRAKQLQIAAAASVAALLALGGTFSLGPTAVWRHSGIGAGRASSPKTRREVREWTNTVRRTLVWDADGRESSVALADPDDLAFVVNGKVDGSARGDAGTQVMSGMVPVTIHPNPHSAFVIGLGTGSTAGWIAAVPSIQRVDVVELEPNVVRVAKDLAAVNHNVLANPKVHIQLNDAREVLLASRGQYDVIFSEPSNPYRAGIASLFTHEYYEAVSSRLAPHGIFMQWMQTYDVDSGTIGTIYKTLTSVFPYVETWRGEPGDLLMMATREPLTYDADMIRARLKQSPWKDAMHDAWRTEGLEGFFSHYLARDTTATAIAANATSMNTDDKTVVEFGFARGLGESSSFSADKIVEVAQKRNEYAPARVHGAINWNTVMLHRAIDPGLSVPPPFRVGDFETHRTFMNAWDDQKWAAARDYWKQSHFSPVNTREFNAIAVVLADDGDEGAASAAEILRPWSETATESILAQLRERQKRYDEAAAHAKRAFELYRNDPWADMLTMGRLFDTASSIAIHDRKYAPMMYDAIDKPFAAGQWGDARNYYRVFIGASIRPCGKEMLAALGDIEPYPQWRDNVLHARYDCYRQAGATDLAKDAERDWNEWIATSPKPLVK